MILRLGPVAAFLLIAAALVPWSSAAQNSHDTRALGTSGLPLPRFVAIDKSAANMRRGPGEDYPLLYQYRRRGLPLEIIAEYGQWRQIRDHEGTEGWMHARLLRGQRTVVVRHGGNTLRPRSRAANALKLRRRADPMAGVVALVQPGAIGRLENCNTQWCAVEIGGHDGWLPRALLWGVYAFEFKN